MTPEENSVDFSRPAGSPPTGEPVFLVVGKIRRPHGLKGDLIFEVITDFPERLRAGIVIYIGDDHLPLVIRNRRWQGSNLLLRFDNYRDPETAAQLSNKLAYVRAEDRPALPEGEYYHHQLLGLEVVTDDHRTLGKLTQILETGANDVYIIQPETGPDVLLPAIDDVILKIDLESGRMFVHLIPGLLPE